MKEGVTTGATTYTLPASGMVWVAVGVIGWCPQQSGNKGLLNSASKFCLGGGQQYQIVSNTDQQINTYQTIIFYNCIYSCDYRCFEVVTGRWKHRHKQNVYIMITEQEKQNHEQNSAEVLVSLKLSNVYIYI